MNNLSLLKSNSVFGTLSDSEINAILKLAEQKSFSKNELVFSDDEEGGCFYVIDRGSFLLNLKDRDSVILSKGELFGEVGVINEHMRSGSIRSIENSNTLVFIKEKLVNPELLDPIISLKLFLALAKNVTNYLKLRHHATTLNVIDEGENEFVEFKSTLRFNLYTQKNDKAMEHAVLKTIAAFMNTKGGTLLIGVNDEGEVLGLDSDKFANDDKMLLHLNKLIQSHISIIHTEFILPVISIVRGEKVLRIDCEPATLPAYVADNNSEFFYIRTGPSTVNLKVSEVYTYIKNRFGEITKAV